MARGCLLAFAQAVPSARSAFPYAFVSLSSKAQLTDTWPLWLLQAEAEALWSGARLLAPREKCFQPCLSSTPLVIPSEPGNSSRVGGKVLSVVGGGRCGFSSHLWPRPCPATSHTSHSSCIKIICFYLPLPQMVTSKVQGLSTLDTVLSEIN